jgi:large repetitive protein
MPHIHNFQSPGIAKWVAGATLFLASSLMAIPAYADAVAPDAPTSVQVDRVFGGITVSWTEPVENGGDAITSYTVTAEPDDASANVTCGWTTGEGALTCDLSGASNTATYSVTVVATNAAGDSAPSAAVTTNGFTAPGAPTISAITPGNTTLTVSITPGTTGGLSITDYRYSLNNGVTSTSFAADAAPFTITGLTNGTTYQVSVAAVNLLNTGTFSSPVSAVPATVPSAPRWLHGVRGSTTATLLWNPSASNGGSAITSYLVSDLHGHTCSTSTLSCTVTGLTNGVAYLFYVVANNSRGASIPSNSNFVTPATTPSAPGIASTVAGNRSIAVTLTSPVSNGGATVGYYDYSIDGGATWASGQYRTKGAVLKITGLVNGTTYCVKVRARNTVGAGTASATVVATPFSIPGLPVVRTIVTTNTTAAVAFATPETGGRAITSYQYSLNNGTTWLFRASGTTASPLVITGLLSSHFYSVRVRAVNTAGAGLPSAPFRFQTK